MIDLIKGITTVLAVMAFCAFVVSYIVLWGMVHDIWARLRPGWKQDEEEEET